MHRLNMQQSIHPKQHQFIFQTIKDCLLPACKEPYIQIIQQQNKPHIPYPIALGDLLCRLIRPFNTQLAGGFALRDDISQQSVDERFTRFIDKFQGILCGIEASPHTIIHSRNTSKSFILAEEGIVYPKHRTDIFSLSSTMRVSLSGYDRQFMRVHRCVQHHTDGKTQTMWLGHISSGTSDANKYPHNCKAFIDAVSGKIMLGTNLYNPVSDISFWDANFDCTDAVNTRLHLPSSIENMLACTTTQPIQIIIPAVRVRKYRFPLRPFFNNQIHKGGEQIAESMVATCPAGVSIKALDDDGLFVLVEGKIFHLLPNQSPIPVSTIKDMHFKLYHAFSAQVWLDHKPIFVQMGETTYSFHNFFDFKGKQGLVSDFWYDVDQLEIQEQRLAERLLRYLE